jgi:hypothetical protein
LRLIVVNGGACGGVAYVGYSCIATKGSHVTRPKDITHQSIPFVQMECVSLYGGNACRILPAVLQNQQAVIQNLIGWCLRDQP